MCVDAVRGVSVIRIEIVRVALLRHHTHTLSGAGGTHSVCVRVCVYIHVSVSTCVCTDIAQGMLMCA